LQELKPLKTNRKKHEKSINHGWFLY